MQASFGALNSTMASTLAGQSMGNRRTEWARQIAEVKALRSEMAQTIQAQGQFAVSQHSVVSATEKFNDAVAKNKVGISDLRKNFGLLRQSYREQIALQNSLAATWSSSTPGKSNVDLFIPKTLNRDMSNARTQLGYANSIISSIATQTINWGKNTQWAGRQIMVGITVPLGIAAAGMAKLTYDTDMQLTRIAKVYDTSAQDYVDNAHRQAAVDQELAQLRETSMNSAITLARKYGSAVTDTLELQANFASTGLSGPDLQKATEQVTRISSLGELDVNAATDMSIALMNAFKMSREEAEEFYNYINQVENSTSLMISDVAAATPRAASALAGLGVTAKEMTVLLAAMKQSGVNAEEGANALKSASTRIINPVPAAVKEFAQYDIAIKDIVATTQGDLFETLKILGKRMQESGMSALQQQQAIGKLFGTYQFNRLNAALSNITGAFDEMGNPINDAGKAMAAMGMSAEELTSIADTELGKLADSASGKFKRYIETIKGELALMGQPVLEAINPVLSVIATLFEKFNSLGDGQKRFVLIALAALGAVGPIMMLVGVFGNLVGSFLKTTTAINNLLLRFTMVNAEERAAAIAAKQVNNVFDAQTASAARLNQQLTELQKSLRHVNTTMQGVARAEGFTGFQIDPNNNGNTAVDSAGASRSIKVDADGNPVLDAKGNARYAAGSKGTNANGKAIRGGGFVSKEDLDAYNAVRVVSGDVAENSKRFRLNMHQGVAAGAGIAVLAGGMASAAGAGGDLSNSLITGAGAVLMVQQAMSMIPWVKTKTNVAGMATNFKGMAGKATNIGKTLLTSFKAAAPLVIGMWPVAAAALVVASAVALYKWTQKTNKEMQAIKESGDAFANAVGVSAELPEINPLTGETQSDKEVENLERRKQVTEQLVKENKNLVDVLKTTSENDADLLRNVQQIGMKVALRGGTEEQVKLAMESALELAGKDGADLKEMMVTLGRIDFTNPEALTKAINENIDKSLDAMRSKNNSKYDKAWLDWFKGSGDLNRAAGEAATEAGSMFADMYRASANSDKGKLLAGLDTRLENETKSLMDNVNKKMTGEGGKAFTGPTALLKALANDASVTAGDLAQLKGATGGLNVEMLKSNKTLQEKLGLSTKDIALLKKQAAEEKTMAQAILTSMNITDKQSQKVSTLEGVSKRLGYAFDAGKISQKQFAEGSAQATEAMEEQAAVAEDLAATMRNDITNAMKTAMGGVMGVVYDTASRQMESEQEARINGIRANGDRAIESLEARADAAMAQFEARQESLRAETERLQDELKESQRKEDKNLEAHWDQVMKSHDKNWDQRRKTEEAAYDGRIDAVEKAIEAEEEAEERREKIFDAEIKRIQRMSQMFSTNIDFNMALNSGDLDEAARVANSASAQQSEWSISDQRDTQGAASEARKEALGTEKDKIQLEKEARLEALDEIEEAEKEALNAQKEREEELLRVRQDAATKALEVERERLDKALEHEKEVYNKSVDANKDRLNKRTQASTDAANADHETRKRGLEQELMALQAFTPRNRAELDAHIEKVKGTYANYGVSLKTSGSEWGKIVGDALASNVETARTQMVDKAKWEELGNSITDGMAAAFDINGDQLMTWLKTGVFPQSTAKVAPGKGNNMPGGGFRDNRTARHSGGAIGFSSKDRTGVPRSASLYPSEYSTILKKNEYVVNEKATRKNLPVLNAINSGSFHTGGLIGAVARHEGGMASIATGMMASVGKAIAASIAKSLGVTIDQASGAGGYGVGGAGKYGNTQFGADQLSNASIIMNTGKSMGASSRDIMIALMTAMQESQLKNINYGDRDSVGLFQQRTSQGWGSIAQIMDPVYSSTKFFEGLLKIKNRDSMAPTEAAQKVQRSAFPNAYAKWQDEAEAIMAGTPMLAGATGALAGAVGQNGRTVELLQSMMNGGPAHRITSTTGGQHAAASYHYKGQAVDLAAARPGKNTPELASIAQWLANNYGSGLMELIYGGPGAINLRNGRPHNYSAATLKAHENHVHAAATPETLKALGIPGLSVGGEIKYNNTIANLHKDEKVLTAPLSAKLDQGIENFATGGGNNYKLDIDLRGATVTDNTVHDIKKAVLKVINDKENRNGRRRVVNG